MLTKEQIDQLFLFCEKHFVRFYDVQVELVDHLANAIEEKMAADENLSFEAALSSVHAGFGPLGFAGFVNSKSGLVYQKYYRIKNRYLKSFFTLPKIALTFCMIVVLSLVPQVLQGEALLYFITGFMIAAAVYEIFIIRRHWRLVRKQPKKLIMTQFGPEQSWFASFSTLQFFMLKPLSGSEPGISFWYYEFVALFTLLVFLVHVAYSRASAQLFSDAKKMYPDAF